MIAHHHRDLLTRVIKLDDIVVWSNAKYGSSIQICRVVGSTEQKVVILLPNGKLTRVLPENLVAITQQVYHNIDNNVGSNLA